ncbi:MAG TPA: succinate dehydrogenase, cytochrome b556 subunit [Caulobacteraceae bacterium]|nr:succinate dehydrogenase, cytochrome b556 subunit [Caulobacteraceae bacterium]
MADAAPGRGGRPQSPSVWIWRWHVTMVCSILHRAAGAILYVGALVLMGWALALATGPDAYAAYTGFLGSLPGKALLFGFALSVFYHLANGVRHLVWDAGYGFAPRTADASGLATLAFAVAAAVVLFLYAGLTGAL